MKVTKYQSTVKGPIPYDRLYPGSLFRIHAEVSRGQKYSKDNTVYRRAQDHEGYYSYDSHDKSRAIVLYPEDKVIALRIVRE